jgi:hypothetical protein
MNQFDQLEKAVEKLSEARTNFLLILPFAKRPEKGQFFEHLVDRHVREMWHSANIIRKHMKDADE